MSQVGSMHNHPPSKLNFIATVVPRLHLMQFHHLFSFKLLIASTTRKRFFPRVSHSVLLHGLIECESLVTYIALIRFLACMYALMMSQVYLILKSVAANFTEIRSVLLVHHDYMFVETVFVSERLCILTARQRALVDWNFLVLGPDMSLEDGALRKLFVAVGTWLHLRDWPWLWDY